MHKLQQHALFVQGLFNPWRLSNLLEHVEECRAREKRLYDDVHEAVDLLAVYHSLVGFVEYCQRKFDVLRQLKFDILLGWLRLVRLELAK